MPLLNRQARLTVLKDSNIQIPAQKCIARLCKTPFILPGSQSTYGCCQHKLIFVHI